MKRWLCVFLIPWTLFANPDSLFDQAAALYNQRDFEGALEVYRQIEGISAELDYNIGNTLMQLNRSSEAIAHYRRAQWLAPGDPDIRANLERAVAVHEAPMPTLPLTRSLTGWWGPQTWQRVFLAGCWLTAGIGLVTTALPRFRPFAFWALPPAVVLLLLAGLGTWASLPSHFSSEAIIKGPQGITRFEPLPDATRQHSLPGGSVVRITDRTRDWVQVETDDVRGWINEEELVQL